VVANPLHECRIPRVIGSLTDRPDEDKSIRLICHLLRMAEGSGKTGEGSLELIAAPAIEKRIFVVREPGNAR
jgi:hypothetical protein